MTQLFSVCISNFGKVNFGSVESSGLSFVTSSARDPKKSESSHFTGLKKGNRDSSLLYGLEDHLCSTLL
jgi:hypothetical protein